MFTQMFSTSCRVLLVFCLTALPMSSHAALINRGSGMVYDTILDITWLQDASLMHTSGYHSSGLTNYQTASDWVSNLSYGGYTDWRLPTITPVSGGTVYNTEYRFDGTSDRGYNNTSQSNELGWMFHHNLGNTSYFTTAGTGPQAGSDSFNTSFTDSESGILYSFINVGRIYWAAQGNIPWSGASWGYSMYNSVYAIGEQNAWGFGAALSSWAVRDGDVASTLTTSPPNNPNDIPEPGSLALFGFALCTVLMRKKKARE